MLALKRNLKTFAFWTGLSFVLGCVCGLVGAVFSKSVGFVTTLREANVWFLYLLPVGGLISVGVYRLFKIKSVDTAYKLVSANVDDETPKWLFVVIYIATCITHLFGGSAGKEGAALQIGAGLAETTARVLKLNLKKKNTLVLCGMSGLFSAVFGTPLAAAVFSFETVRAGKKRFAELFPCVVSSLSAFRVAQLLGATAERFYIAQKTTFSFVLILKICLIAVLASFMGFIFSKTLKYTSKFSKYVFKNEFVRIFIGGCIVAVVIFFAGAEYSGSSIDGISKIFESSQVKKEAFIIKVIVTAITLGFGYKGGKIIPSLFIGATLGATLSILFGVSMPLCAAVGMATLFCSITKCPVAACVLCVEMFSGKLVLYILVAIICSYVIDFEKIKKLVQ